jgi:hypothetical protein
MTLADRSQRGGVRPRSVEFALAALVLVGIAAAGWLFLRDGYLPQPFYFRVSESLLDLYSPALRANNAGAYDRWRSLYPPLSFVFLKLVSLKSCYGSGELVGRDCDWLVRLVLLAVFLGNIALVYVTYRISDARTAAPRAIAMALGLPMLYALERGNLLIPCFTCFALGYGDVLRSRWSRCLALALSMNFKPYLGLVALPLVIKRYWAWVLGCGLFGVGVYLVTWWIYGSGGPMEIIANDAGYAVAATKGYFGDLYYATSYWPLIRLLNAPPPGLSLGSAAVTQVWSLILTVLLRVGQAASLACLVTGLFRPKRVDVRRMGALVAGVSITAFTTGSAGYAQIFLFFLVFFEPWRGPTRIALLAAVYILCIPVDMIILPLIHERAHSYLGGRMVMATFGLSAGQILRPAILLVVQYLLVTLNLTDLFGPSRTVGDSFHVRRWAEPAATNSQI